MIDLKDNEEQCEYCEGTGKRRYSAVYHNGDLYHDAETMECDECNGTGKVHKIPYKELADYVDTKFNVIYDQAIDNAIKIITTLWELDPDFHLSLHDKIISELSKLKSNEGVGK